MPASGRQNTAASEWKIIDRKSAKKSTVTNSDGFERERRRMFAIHVAHAVFLGERRRDTDSSTAFHEARIARQSRNHPPNKLRAFAIGQIEPSARRSRHHQFGSDQPGVE